MVVALAGWTLGHSHTARHAHLSTLAQGQELSTPTVSATEPLLLPVQRPRDPRVDLYGNEVEEAVGDYREDSRGHTYERHSPATELTRLGPPST